MSRQAGAETIVPYYTQHSDPTPSTSYDDLMHDPVVLSGRSAGRGGGDDSRVREYLQRSPSATMGVSESRENRDGSSLRVGERTASLRPVGLDAEQGRERHRVHVPEETPPDRAGESSPNVLRADSPSASCDVRERRACLDVQRAWRKIRPPGTRAIHRYECGVDVAPPTILHEDSGARRRRRVESSSSYSLGAASLPRRRERSGGTCATAPPPARGQRCVIDGSPGFGCERRPRRAAPGTGCGPGQQMPPISPEADVPSGQLPLAHEDSLAFPEAWLPVRVAARSPSPSRESRPCGDLDSLVLVALLLSWLASSAYESSPPALSLQPAVHGCRDDNMASSLVSYQIRRPVLQSARDSTAAAVRNQNKTPQTRHAPSVGRVTLPFGHRPATGETEAAHEGGMPCGEFVAGRKFETARSRKTPLRAQTPLLRDALMWQGNAWPIFLFFLILEEHSVHLAAGATDSPSPRDGQVHDIRGNCRIERFSSRPWLLAGLARAVGRRISTAERDDLR
ncbi:hypothetical protein JHW43_007463 [Diplocarpon mali]|nr:hypothetical protein JHW43_007463 [Diplocarpon mali]